MKKRTCVPFYDKTCQRLDGQARAAVDAAMRNPAHAKPLLQTAEKCREAVKARLRRKRGAA